MVVKALNGSPWGTFTIAATMPIALFMGVYLRFFRPGKVLEVSAIGFVLRHRSRSGAGNSSTQSPTLAPLLHPLRTALAGASSSTASPPAFLPVWLLLAPRDYLSTFMKLGAVVAARRRHPHRAAAPANARP